LVLRQYFPRNISRALFSPEHHGRLAAYRMLQSAAAAFFYGQGRLCHTCPEISLARGVPISPSWPAAEAALLIRQSHRLRAQRCESWKIYGRLAVREAPFMPEVIQLREEIAAVSPLVQLLKNRSPRASSIDAGEIIFAMNSR
jgi:hypothetical protein